MEHMQSVVSERGGIILQPPLWPQLLLQVILIAINAYFAATEIAVISLNEAVKQTIICNRAGNFPYEAFCAFIKKTRAIQIRTFINLDNAFCLAGRQNFNQAAHFRSSIING